MNDPASADGFTVIFNKARDEKKGGNTQDTDSPMKDDRSNKPTVGHATRSNSVSFFLFVIDPELTPVKRQFTSPCAINTSLAEYFIQFDLEHALIFKYCLDLGLILAPSLLNLALSLFFLCNGIQSQLEELSNQ